MDPSRQVEITSYQPILAQSMLLYQLTGSINSDFSAVNVHRRDVVGSDAHGDVGNSPSAALTLTTNTGSISLHEGQ